MKRNQGSKDRDQILTSHYYDEIGVKEWLRLEADARLRVIHHIHSRTLGRYVKPGDRVLDAGCGAGRFFAELVDLGAHVTAGDISAVQVELAHQALERVAPDAARGRVARMDVAALPFTDGCFDAVLCFGAVLSHLAGQAEAGAAELARVARVGGVIALSAQSSRNYYLPDIIGRVHSLGLDAVDDALMNGKPLPDSSGVPWREFSRGDLASLARDIGCEILEVRASNVLATVADIPLLEELERDARLWQAFLRWEEHLGLQSGNVDRGAHTIAVMRRLF